MFQVHRESVVPLLCNRSLQGMVQSFYLHPQPMVFLPQLYSCNRIQLHI
jgi:hypothetical protein